MAYTQPLPVKSVRGRSDTHDGAHIQRPAALGCRSADPQHLIAVPAPQHGCQMIHTPHSRRPAWHPGLSSPQRTEPRRGHVCSATPPAPDSSDSPV